MMDNIQLKRLTTPMMSGKTIYVPPNQSKVNEPQKSFQDILQSNIQKSQLTFSSHAVARVAQREMDFSEQELERLNKGLAMAKEKGLNETLILVDKNAFIVSAKNNTVITTVNNNELTGNVFTNIEGTVII